jgi:hypothetical protein
MQEHRHDEGKAIRNYPGAKSLIQQEKARDQHVAEEDPENHT